MADDRGKPSDDEVDASVKDAIAKLTVPPVPPPDPAIEPPGPKPANPHRDDA